MLIISVFWDRAVIGLAYLAGLVFWVGALYITADVLGRKFLGIHSGVTAEIGGYMLSAGVAWGMAYALRSGGHVRIDIIQARLPAPLRFVTDQVALAVMGLFALITAGYSWKLALDSYEIGARALSVLGTPLVIPQVAMAAGFSLLAMESVALLVRRMRGRGRGRPGDDRGRSGQAAGEKRNE